jgi:hypothetical protein
MRIRILVVSFHLLRIKYFFFSIEVHVVNIGAYAQFQMMYSSFLINTKYAPMYILHTTHGEEYCMWNLYTIFLSILIIV